jgi:hypothetical protein
MNQQLLISKLIELTGGLQPTQSASLNDLQNVRRSLAYSFSQGQIEPDEKRSTFEAFGQIPIEEIDDSLVSELQEIISQFEGRENQPQNFTIFRRELPVLSSQIPASVPPWAAGQKIEKTVGPFIDITGRPIWFDFYLIVQQVQVVRLPGLLPFLILPLRGLIIQSSASYPLPAGSIWIASQLLNSQAPGGAYTGLSIKGGTFRLSAPATVVGDVLQVGSDVTCSLTIQINQPETPGAVFGPGVDAGNVITQLPAEVTIEFSPKSASIGAAADASAELYGSEVRLQRSTGVTVYEPALNRILVPFKATSDQFEVVACRSNLFQLSGTAPIQGGAWALPVAVADPMSLGKVSGAGAIIVIIEPGLQCQWNGLEGNPVKLNNAFLMVEPGRLTVVALQAKNSRSSQIFTLWRESAANSLRSSSVEVFYQTPFILRYFSQQTGVEALLTTGTVAAHLDRPLQADGAKLGIRLPDSEIQLYEDKNGFFVLLNGRIPQVFSTTFIPQPKIALVISNALLKTTPVKALNLWGKLETDNQVVNGFLRLSFGLFFLLPILPDPYATNISFFRNRGDEDQLTAKLIATTQWDVPDTSKLSFSFATLTEISSAGFLAENPGDIGMPASSPAIEITNRVLASTRIFGITKEELEIDKQSLEKLREQFDETLGSVREQLFLLDVSGNADQMGVGIGFAFRGDNRDNPVNRSDAFPVRIRGLDLVTSGQNVRIFTVPGVQWEPVRTIQNPKVKPFPFPSPFLTDDDGGPTLIGVNTVSLVPIAPRPVLEQLVTEFNTETDNKRVAALFTLPFGMTAVARLKKVNFEQIDDDILKLRGSELALNQPKFPDHKLTGGLQLSATATINPLFKEFIEESPYLEGATIQLRNGVNDAGVPLVDDNGVPLSILGPAVDAIFNQEFGPNGKNPRVPVTRIDFSGYGSSVFSDWVNPSVEPPGTVKVRFDVMVGRTSYEVIQVKTVLFPCCAVNVRTITIQRTNSGGIVRSDSAWQPVTPGLYKYPGLTFHPGIIKGYFNIRNIRDTAQIFKIGTEPDNVLELAAVYFDADIQIDDVVRGANNGLVSSPNQLGFVLLRLPKNQNFMMPSQFAELLKNHGPLGGPVDCLVDVGKSGQHMRVTRVDFSTALTTGNNPVFVGAARGSLVLPSDGAWSLTRQITRKTDEHQALDSNFGLPLISEGDASIVLNPAHNNPNPLRFADPVDLFNSFIPASEYGLLFSTDTQRLLFLRPKIERGSRQITSTERPLLADMYALMTALGIFPKASNCIPVPTNNYQLEIQNGGGFKLSLPFSDNKFTVTPFTRNLKNSPPTRTYTEYADDRGRPTEIAININSLATPSWSIKMSPVSVVLDFEPFEKLMRIVGTIEAQNGIRTQLSNPSVVYGSVLSPAQEVITILKDFGLPAPMLVSMAYSGADNAKYSFNTRLGFSKEKIDTGFGKLDLMFEGKFKIGLESGPAFDRSNVEFSVKVSGAMQQPIIPKILFAGGLLELEIGISEDIGKQKSSITLVAGAVASLGGKDVIPKVLKLEATVKRGYFLAFEDKTLKPGVLLGIEGQFGLLGIEDQGTLIGIGFEAEAKGSVARISDDTVNLKAELTIAFSICVAWVFEIEEELETEYNEDLPLLAVAGLGAALAVSGAPLVTL